MTKKHPREKAFQEFIKQTEKAKSEEIIYTEEFQKCLTRLDKKRSLRHQIAEPMSTKAKAFM